MQRRLDLKTGVNKPFEMFRVRNAFRIFSAIFLNNFYGKFVIFLAPNFECFTKYDAFCSHSFDYACLRRRRHIVMKRFENRHYGKILFVQNIVENGWWGNGECVAYALRSAPPLPGSTPGCTITKDGLKF